MLSEDGSKVVYWFGAGASAKSMPIVSEMFDSLRSQVPRIYRITNNTLSHHSAVKKYDEELRNLANLSIEFGSLDTYARSLYLQGDQVEALAHLKLHLSLFFYLETLLLPSSQPQFKQYHGYNKDYDVDPRYMGWLALLLNDGLIMNRRVKAISWNYDCQVELALGRYCKAGGVGQMHERFKIHPSIDTSEITEDNFFLTHLNGIAGQEKRQDKFHAWYNSLVGVYPNQISGLFALYGDDGDMGKNLRSGFVDRLTFAWEGNETASRAIELAESALRNADALVIVGYSFPPFNRLIDKRLIKEFDQGPTLKRIILQNPTASVDQLSHLFELDSDRIKVEVDTTSIAFHLPNELFVD